MRGRSTLYGSSFFCPCPACGRPWDPGRHRHGACPGSGDPQAPRTALPRGPPPPAHRAVWRPLQNAARRRLAPRVTRPGRGGLPSQPVAVLHPLPPPRVRRVGVEGAPGRAARRARRLPLACFRIDPAPTARAPSSRVAGERHARRAGCLATGRPRQRQARATAGCACDAARRRPGLGVPAGRAVPAAPRRQGPPAPLACIAVRCRGAPIKSRSAAAESSRLSRPHRSPATAPHR